MASHTEKKLKAKIRDQKEELNMAWDRVQDAEDQVAQAESENNDCKYSNA